MLDDYFIRVFDSLLSSFAVPQKRVFFGYLISATLIAIFWLILKKGLRVRSALQFVFNPNVWFSKSAKTDYFVLIINRFVAVFCAPYLLAQLSVATFFFESLHHVSLPEPLWQDHFSLMSVGLLFTLSLFLLDDFTRYALHRALHQIPWLWAFHRVHHSATTMTPLTVFRTHPVENVLFGLRSALVQGLCLGFFVFFFGDKVDLLTVFGANMFLFGFNLLGANLRHSHVSISYPVWLERWLISPAQHHIHHSVARKHFDKNYGVVLAVWDRFGCSLYLSEKNQILRFGLDDKQSETEHSLYAVYGYPFILAFQSFRSSVLRWFSLSVKSRFR